MKQHIIIDPLIAITNIFYLKDTYQMHFHFRALEFLLNNIYLANRIFMIIVLLYLSSFTFLHAHEQLSTHHIETTCKIQQQYQSEM